MTTICFDNSWQRFYLAGNQEQEFLKYQQQQQGGSQSQKGKQQEEENEGSNILSGFAPEFLKEAFGVNMQIVRNLQGENEEEDSGAIVTVKGGLRVTAPAMRKPQQEEDDDDEEEQPQCVETDKGCQRQSKRSRNGIDETICTMRLRQNIGQNSSPDIYNPQAGSITTATSLDFPALWLLKLSAQYGSLRKVRTSYML